MRPQFEAPADEAVSPSRRFRRDTRTAGQRVIEALSSRIGLTALIFGCALAGMIAPAATPLWLLLGGIVFALGCLKQSLWRTQLPLRLPQESELIDFHDPMPGRRGFHRARGVGFLGNEWARAPGELAGSELWLSFQDLLTHLLCLGTTGSGKTEMLVSLLFSAGIAIGSGGLYVDPKGTIKLAAQIYVLSRLLGRDDDFRLMNFQTGAKPPGRSCRRLSNTANPLSFGTPENISQTILSLVPEPEGDNAVFAQSAHALMNAETYAVADLRDQGVPVSIATLREYLDADKFVALAHDPRVKEANRLSMMSFLGGVQWREDPMWELVKARLHQAADRDPGQLSVVAPKSRSNPTQSSATEQAQQAQQILEPFYQQFGFARSYFNQLMNSLVDTYGHIYGATRPEIDMPDVILQRRILAALLPAMEKSPAETRNIGKLTLAMIRNAAATGLGSRAMGTLREVIYSLPSAAAKPMPVITDEYSAIAVEGYELVMTQGRGLGIVAMIGNQDFAGMTKGGDKGTGVASAAQIVANTGLKLALKTADPKDTWDLFRALAAEADVVKAQRYGRPQSSVGHYTDVAEVNVQREARIDLRDLQQQIQGEFHAFFNGRIVRGFSFYAAPPLKESFQMRVHEMLQVLPPAREVLDQRHGAPQRVAERLAALIRGSPHPVDTCADTAQLGAVRSVFADSRGLYRMETAIAAAWNWINSDRARREGFGTASGSVCEFGGTPLRHPDRTTRRGRGMEREGGSLDMLEAFEGIPEIAAPPPWGESLASQQITHTTASGSSSVLSGLAADLDAIERSLGRSEERAAEESERFRDDIARALEYPAAALPPTDADTPERLNRAIRRLIRGVSRRPTREE